MLYRGDNMHYEMPYLYSHDIRSFMICLPPSKGLLLTPSSSPSCHLLYKHSFIKHGHAKPYKNEGEAWWSHDVMWGRCKVWHQVQMHSHVYTPCTYVLKLVWVAVLVCFSTGSSVQNSPCVFWVESQRQAKKNNTRKETSEHYRCKGEQTNTDIHTVCALIHGAMPHIHPKSTHVMFLA